MNIELKRVYVDQGQAAGYRVLVDRMWPRGIAKAKMPIDEWLRDLAPTRELLAWFHRDRSRWTEFRRKYLRELDAHGDDLDRLRAIAAKKPLILLYSAKDESHNQAAIIREALQSPRARQRRTMQTVARGGRAKGMELTSEHRAATIRL